MENLLTCLQLNCTLLLRTNRGRVLLVEILAAPWHQWRSLPTFGCGPVTGLSPPPASQSPASTSLPYPQPLATFGVDVADPNPRWLRPASQPASNSAVGIGPSPMTTRRTAEHGPPGWATPPLSSPPIAVVVDESTQPGHSRSSCSSPMIVTRGRRVMLSGCAGAGLPSVAAIFLCCDYYFNKCRLFLSIRRLFGEMLTRHRSGSLALVAH